MSKLFLLLFLINCSCSYCQNISILQFGNVVYYKISNLSEENLRGTNRTWGDKKISNRYFDTYLKADSIKIIINDSCYSFYQKKIPEPKEYKNFILFKNRCLKNDNIVIKNLKIIEINNINILAEAYIKYNKNGKMVTKNQLILLPLNEIEGVCLGPGENSRKLLYGIEITGVFIAGLILTISIIK